jgi:hypothetical protein
MIIVIIGVQWGFHKNYLSQFPDFIDKTVVIHIHGALWMSWLILLIVQPFLIQTGRVQLHKNLGKLSYVIGPLLIMFLFLAGRGSYWGFMQNATEKMALKFMVLDTRGLFSFAIFWILAMYFRKNPPTHMRYMIATGILAIGPGFGRGLVNSFNFDFDTVFKGLDLLNIAIVGVLLGFDIYKGRNYRPFLVVFVCFTTAALLWQFRNSELWTTFARVYARWLY